MTISAHEPPAHLRSEYDFKVDLPWAKKRERFAAGQTVMLAEQAIEAYPLLAHHLAGDDGNATYEVKAERQAFKTGNFFVEYARQKNLQADESLEMIEQGVWRATLRKMVFNESGKRIAARDDNGMLIHEQHEIREGSGRFQVEHTNLQPRLIEATGISVSTADFWCVVLGRTVVTVPREALHQKMREAFKNTSRRKNFSGDNEATRGVLITLAELCTCSTDDLMDADWQPVELLGN
jgi:hypothetical protein